MKKWLTKFFENQIVTNFLIISGTFFTFVILDLGIRYFSNQYTNFYGWTHASPFFFTISWIFFFLMVLYLLPKKMRMITYSILTGIFNILVLAQMIHQKILGRFFGIYDLFLAGEGAGYFMAALKQITPAMILLFFLSILSCVVVCLIIHFQKEPIKTRKYYFIVLALGLCGFTCFRLMAIDRLGEKTEANAWDRWNNVKDVYLDFNNQSKNMEVAGLYEMTFRNIDIYIKDQFQSKENLKIEVDDYFNSQALEVSNIEEEVGQNEYTGLFKDKNLIFIMLESIDSWLVDDEVMPTLSYLEKTGWNFTNRYAPAFGGGMTFNSEFAANTGLYSINNGQASYNFDNNAYPYSLPSLFVNNGYRTNSIHVNYGNFYNRSSIHKAIGYQNHFALQDLYGNDEVNYFYDSNLVKQEESYRLIVPETDQFMSFVITYTAHMPYDNSNDKCVNNPYQLQVEGDEALSCIRNLAKDTDEFLKELLMRLDQEHRLEDTVLILFTDHYTYAYPNIQFVYEQKASDNTNLLQNVPFLIWSKDITPKQIDTLMSTTDILPTIANLFGLEGYDPDHYLSSDVFSIRHPNYVYFADNSWYDGTLYYHGQEVSEELQEYVSKISTEVQTKIKINEDILLSDYYKK